MGMLTPLEIADKLLVAARNAQAAGDTMASLELALAGAQWLQLARIQSDWNRPTPRGEDRWDTL